jgi:hypothetical protein
MCLHLIYTTASRVLTLLARTAAITIGKAEQAIGQVQGPGVESNF